MSQYNLLPAHLHKIADAAMAVIKTRYNLTDPIIESSIDSSIGWQPTLLWKVNTGYIACEVHETPMPPVIKSAFGDISTSGIPVRVIVAHPANDTISQSEFIKESNEVKRYGCGLVSINDDSSGTFQFQGIDIPLYFPVPKYSQFNKKMQADIQKAYEFYINGDPRHGVQELGQVIENIITHLAYQAKKKGTLTKGGFPPAKGKHYAFATLVEDLMRENVIDNGILGRCRGFADDRNACSHRPKTIKQAIEVNKKLRTAMTGGLQILEEIPQKLKDKGYTLKLT
jgi:hypothetical protein